MNTTYIIETKSGELYYGVSTNLVNRIIEHKNGFPAWFNKDLRRDFIVVYKKQGNCMKRIKRIGVKKFMGKV